ncbi:group II intron maturase-specific domain-containing protein [Streptomyces lancefieldiae]|uniref:Group II intron maturase-specific domain-containing protein n=1 Tax=Streptomyces lancefieldiae TaxID=3075520 RepID=A0ABU3B154_9ACTN|nr:group II intron maturase-specific domain-containing protein [Streptomyces sp. DSM 40712]MDT0616182.1 group II intron maturase-specific domain-containing protein [Streptomyces sp. DSM 40712]
MAPQARNGQVVRLHLHRRPARPVSEGEDPYPHPQNVAAGPGRGADQSEQGHPGWANYFRHAVAKRTFSNLDNLVWWRVIRLLQERHHWNWSDVRRRLTTPTGRWLPISAGEIELRKISAIPVTRYRYRGNMIPTPWPPATT